MPPAEIVTGTLSELEDALAGAIENAREEDRLAPVTVMVGHVLLKRYLPRMLAARGIAQMNVRFVRPNELAEALSPGADRERARLSPAAERLLVRGVASMAGGYFEEIAGGDRFGEALMRLFRELEMGGFDDAPRLGQALRDADPDGNHEKFDELTALYGRYFVQRAAAHLIAPAARYAAADSASFEGPLLVYGLWSPSELQVRLVERVAAVAPVSVYIARSGLDADDAHAAFRERLLAAGATERAIGGGTAPGILPKDAADEEQHRFVHRLNGGSDMERLAGALFRDGAQVVDAPDATLVSAPDTVREVWEAARACLEWAKIGIRFHEMAVVYRNRDPYRALVAEIFNEARISIYLHDGRPLSAHLGSRTSTICLFGRAIS